MCVHCTQLTLLCHLYIPVSHVHTYIKVIPNRAILLQPKLPLRDRAKISSGIYLGNGFVTHHLSRFTIDKKYFISFFFLQCTILLLLSLYKGRKKTTSFISCTCTIYVAFRSISDSLYQDQNILQKTENRGRDTLDLRHFCEIKVFFENTAALQINSKYLLSKLLCYQLIYRQHSPPEVKCG